MGLKERKRVPRPLTVSESLVLARKGADGAHEASAILEGALQELYRRIEGQTEEYIMSKEEYKVLNYFQDRWKNNRLFQKAVFNFWKNYKAPPTAVALSTTSSEMVTKDVLDMPPPGYLGPDSMSKVFQTSLQNFCDSQDIATPTYTFVSDRRGGRSACSCLVAVGDQKFAARYWYDGKYFTTAKEDAADEALRRLIRKLTASALHQHTLRTNKKDSSTQYPLEGTDRVTNKNENKKRTAGTASSGSEVNSLWDDTFESESPDQLQTFFDPETGATSTLTPRTSIYSDGRDAESEYIYPSDEQAVQELVVEKRNQLPSSQQKTTPNMVVKDVYPTAQRGPFFRVSDGKGRVLGARTSEKEFWIHTTTERPALIDSSNRIIQLYWWRRARRVLVHLVDHLIDPWAILWAMTILLLRMTAWLTFTGIDKFTGKHLRTAFEQSSLMNTTKLLVEDITGAFWDWWPLLPSRQPLRKSEFLMDWYCDMKHQHWSQISGEDVSILEEEIKRRWYHEHTLNFSGNFVPFSTASETNTSNAYSPVSRNNPQAGPSGHPSSSATPGHTSQGQSCLTSGQDRRDSFEEARPPGTGIALDIIGPNDLKGFVIFAVQGAKRLQAVRTHLAQIDVTLHNDDDSFFNEMKIQYQTLRGSLRRGFSIWTFMTCEFVELRKENPGEVFIGPNGMPTSDDGEYRYESDQDPPVLPKVFNKHFYGCRKGCIRSQLDVLRLFHECQGHNHCGRFKILNRLPKRLRKWNLDQDQEKDHAWGLHAAFGVSFLRVMLYHALMLAGPMVFWGLWLRRWPRDWQNASIPLFGVVMLLSLFWLPFTQASSSDSTVKKVKTE